MSFRFTKKDLKLQDGNKKNAIQLRKRMLELYNVLVLKMEAETELKNFVKNTRPRNGLRTVTPYVPNYYLRTGGARRSSWIGFADKTRYQDPRTGIQYQFGLRHEDKYWFGIWIQGDSKTRRT